MAYVQYVMVNHRCLDDNKINADERLIIARWQEEGHIEQHKRGLVVTKDFWNFMCAVLWHGYVSYDSFKEIRVAVRAAGEVWETESRKGRLLVKLREDADLNKDHFFTVVVMSGKASYASEAYQIHQAETGMGMEGSEIRMRTSLVTWIRRRNDLEQGVKA